MAITVKQAYAKGWAASERSVSCDLSAAEDRFYRKWRVNPYSAEGMAFTSGWSDQSCGYFKGWSLLSVEERDFIEAWHDALIEPPKENVTNDRTVTYELLDWMAELDSICLKRLGVDTSMLPDADYWNAWTDGVSVDDAFNDFMARHWN